MKKDLQLKVQAWLDGELPDREARRIGEWIARDSEASALAAELGCIKQAMFRNESAATPGESREFYWSKIERQIQREAGLRGAGATPWSARWRRYLAPALGMAALACVLFVAVRQAGPPTFDEVSSTIDGMEAVTFHDQSSQMTVVWLQDATPAAVQDKPVQERVPSESKPASVVDM
jgi:anti-sigma factor RsiW